VVAALCALYAGYGLFLASRMVWTDGEMGLLPAGYGQLRQRYQASWGVPLPVGPARLSYRLPGAYWLYAWAPHVPRDCQLALGRAFSLALSLPGVAATLIWAGELGGPFATLAAGIMLLSSATLVGTYATASYEGVVASLWMVGLYAAWHGAPTAAVACGAALAGLRHTAYWQAWALWLAAGTDLAGAVAIGSLVVLFCGAPASFWTVFWWGTPPPGLPRDGWVKGGRVLAQRYEPFAGWLALALVSHAWTPVTARLAAVTLGLLVVQHGQRAWWRPKWVVGYLPDFALPVVLILAVAIAPALGKVDWWPYVLLWLGWGLWRRRHPALP